MGHAMSERAKFYHPLLALLAATLLGMPPAVAEPAAAPASSEAGAVAPPPRSTADIVRLLDHYKPDPAVAAKALAEADAKPPVTEERQALFDFYWQRGRAAGVVGRVSQQIADLRLAADNAAGAVGGDLPRVFRELATAEHQGGNLLNATRATEAAIRATPNNQNGQLLAAYQQSAGQLPQLGDRAGAAEALRNAEAILVRLRQGRNWNDYQYTWQAQLERARGEVLRADGKLPEAEAAFRRGLGFAEKYIPVHAELLQRRSDYKSWPGSAAHFREVMERLLASTLLQQDKLAEAEIYARQALRHALERVGRASVDAAQGVNLLARVIAEQGRYAEAATLAEEALRCFEQAGAAKESIQLARARGALGGALTAQGRYAEADKVFTQMREGLRADPELLRRVGAGDPDWVIAQLRVGRQEDAERMASAMYQSAAAKHADEPVRVAERRALYAMTLAARQAPEARGHFTASLPILIDRARSEAESDAVGLRKQLRLVIYIEAYLRLLAGPSGTVVTDEALIGEAFTLAEVARGSSVQRALTASAARANLGDPVLMDLARREQDARRRAGALSELLSQLMAAPPEQQLPKIQGDLRRDIEALRAERDTLRKTIAKQFPDYAALVDPPPARLADARAVLRPEEVLVAFYAGEDQAYVWAARADGRAVFAAIPQTRAQLAATVGKLRKALDPGAVDIDQIPPFDVVAAHSLYRTLLGPVEPLLADASTVLVAPHGPLAQLPLALLPTTAVAQPGKSSLLFAGYKIVPWLMRRYAVVQLPSMTALTSLRRLKPADPSRQPFIGFGNPLFSKAQAASAGMPLLAAGTTRGAKGRHGRLRNAVRTARADSAGLALLPRLPDTQEEILEVAKALGADPAQDAYLETRATEQAVLTTDLSHRRVVMFSTHGLIPGDLDGLTQPALALTSPDVTPGGGDGFLTLDKVLTLKLNADWVVMSACNTAAGDGAGSEAVSGLGRGFFFAGARAVLASNWPVETEAARLIMTQLFRLQAADASLSKAEALRRAMLAVADGPGSVDPKTGKADYSHAHPLFWAPFVVVGD